MVVLKTKLLKCFTRGKTDKSHVNKVKCCLEEPFLNVLFRIQLFKSTQSALYSEGFSFFKRNKWVK